MVTMMKTGYKVGDIMTPTVIFVAPDTNLQDCAKKMAEKKIGSLLVLENKKLIGIFTEQDMVRKSMLNNGKPAEMSAKNIMSENIVSTKPEEDLMFAMHLMRDNNVRHLPVMHEKKVVGLITVKDIIKIEPELFELIRERYIMGKDRNY